MALNKNNLFFLSLMILVSLFGVSFGGTIHKVGDSQGWTMMGVNYEDWSSSKTFKVGDTLVFEYNNAYHDVNEVTPHDFESCDPSKPLAKYQTGSDTVKLTKPGFHHFICGVPGHCDIGQKLDILVLPTSLGPVAAPVPTPVQSPSSSSSPLYKTNTLAYSPTNAPQYQMGPSSRVDVQRGESNSLGSWIGLSILLALIVYCWVL
ncbi:unnamed protein product [Cochlearia groenlandica]